MDAATLRKTIRLEKMKAILLNIDRELDELESIDIYGDIGENFCEGGSKSKKDRITKRLIRLINADIKAKTIHIV